MRTFCADFETTVYEGQTNTEVWSSALVELHSENVLIFTNIGETLSYLSLLKENLIVYYHNLKFDGAFWIHYLMTQTDYQPWYTQLSDTDYQWNNKFKMPPKTYQYTISEMGQWYTIRIATKYNIIEIRDSLKLLPFNLKKIGKSFKTKHQKLEMEYEGERYSGCYISPEEKEYIRNDVLVLKEAIEIMEQQHHTKLTIGSCCLSEFKSFYGKDDYNSYFPDLTEVECPIESFRNADHYVRKSYKGGWCYLADGCNDKEVTDGITLDVNSLYPSMMHSMSGNVYPIGKPTWFTGSLPDNIRNAPNKYFFIRIRCRFRIKKGYLPTVQIKGSLVYKGNEWLKTSDVKGANGAYYNKYTLFGEEHDTRVTLTLTKTDYILFHEHYDVFDYEELDGCWFWTEIGLFDNYIDKYKQIKMSSTGAIRELAKLFLNNLYGKLGANDSSSFKIAYLRDDNSLGYKTIEAHEKQVGYIPCGSAITSYARNFTIRTAQKNYHPNSKGFIYADTDSIHCNLPIDQIVGAKLDKAEFCCWKHESTWDKAIFVRQKTYIEHIIAEGTDPCTPYNNIKCAGMGQRCKDLLNVSLGETVDLGKITDEEQIFIAEHRTLEDFKVGLKVPSKLLPKNIDGGVLLCKTTFEMR